MDSKDKVDETYNLIVRTIDQDNLPDVENYIKGLHAKGFFKKLIDDGNLTVEEVKKLPIAKMCEVFFRKGTEALKTGDIRIFKKTGNYEVYFSAGG